MDIHHDKTKIHRNEKAYTLLFLSGITLILLFLVDVLMHSNYIYNSPLGPNGVLIILLGLLLLSYFYGLKNHQIISLSLEKKSQNWQITNMVDYLVSLTESITILLTPRAHGERTPRKKTLESIVAKASPYILKYRSGRWSIVVRFLELLETTRSIVVRHSDESEELQNAGRPKESIRPGPEIMKLINKHGGLKKFLSHIDNLKKTNVYPSFVKYAKENSPIPEWKYFLSQIYRWRSRYGEKSE